MYQKGLNNTYKTKDNFMPNGESSIGALLSLWGSYAWFVILAIWGGTINYFNRVRRAGIPFSFVELVGEWSVAGFTGLITAYICVDLGFSFALTAALTGISGHMGGRGLFMLEQYIMKKLGVKSEQLP